MARILGCARAARSADLDSARMPERLRGTELLDALERGELRVAERGADGRWNVQAWIKEAILELFRGSAVEPKGLEGAPAAGASVFRDKQPFDVRRFDERSEVRVVPGG